MASGVVYAGQNYRSGDSVDLTGFTASAFVTSAGTTLLLFIPLNKPVVASGASVSANISVRTVAGTYMVNNASISSLGSVNPVIRGNGVSVSVIASSAFNVTNNTPVSVFFESGAKITFT